MRESTFKLMVLQMLSFIIALLLPHDWARNAYGFISVCFFISLIISLFKKRKKEVQDA